MNIFNQMSLAHPFVRALRFGAPIKQAPWTIHLFQARRFLTVLLCVTACASAQADSQASTVVGEVSLVLGKAYRLSQMGAREQLERGSMIIEGDQIDTHSNGHVHVRFIDNALVSVRPNSTLVVERYDYDAESPTDSAVKFDLQEGVARAISGEAAKAARDRFRLNTPIAAIGVRGTDFVVSVSAEATRALVNEGAIVMAPFSDNCIINALGPCVANALELTGTSLQLASMQQDEPLPRLLPSQSVRAPNMMQEEVQLAIARNANSEKPSSLMALAPESAGELPQEKAEQGVNNEVLLEGVTTVKVRADAQVAVESVAAKDFIPIDPVVVTQAAEGSVALFDLTPPISLTSSGLRDRQLVWGRYAFAPLATDRLALSFEEAIATRNITVGNVDYGLFRAEPGPRRIESDLGLVGFQLTSAQAVFNSATGIVAMTVNGGSLDIDFQDSVFSTALDLLSDETGSILFTASGEIADGGFLRALEATQRVAGAVSFDGSEAGYFFEKQIDGGTLSGLTLWDSK